MCAIKKASLNVKKKVLCKLCFIKKQAKKQTNMSFANQQLAKRTMQCSTAQCSIVQNNAVQYKTKKIHVVQTVYNYEYIEITLFGRSPNKKKMQTNISRFFLSLYVFVFCLCW